MRTITKTYEVYPLHELPLEAQKHAHANWAESSHCYDYDDYNIKTLKVFKSLFNLQLRGSSYDEYGYNVGRLEVCTENIKLLTGVRLATYIQNNYHYGLFNLKTIYHKNLTRVVNNIRKSRILYDTPCCVLTGYCVDDEFLAPIYEFLRLPEKDLNFEQLIYRCLRSGLKACHEDVKYSFSFEAFQDYSESSGIEYLVMGTEFND